MVPAGVRDRGGLPALLLPGHVPVDDDGGRAHRAHARAGLRRLALQAAILLRRRVRCDMDSTERERQP